MPLHAARSLLHIKQVDTTVGSTASRIRPERVFTSKTLAPLVQKNMQELYTETSRKVVARPFEMTLPLNFLESKPRSRKHIEARIKKKKEKKNFPKPIEKAIISLPITSHKQATSLSLALFDIIGTTVGMQRQGRWARKLFTQSSQPPNLKIQTSYWDKFKG